MKFVVPSESGSARLDFFLARILKDSYSRTKIKQMIEAGSIQINQKPVKPHTRVVSGDEVTMVIEKKREDHTRAEAIPIDVIYEDEDIIVVNKPMGMIVHPGSGNPSGTLVNALLHYARSLSHVGDAERPGIVHRLDKDTSGIMVVAKNDRSHRILSDQFRRHSIQRVYWVVVKGVVQHDEMRSNEPLGRSVTDRKRVIVKADDGRASTTNFRVLKRYHNATLLEARPETGRTHQIRVHLRALGYPVLGDLTYGVRSPHIERQALHAKELSFTHPTSQEQMNFRSELPEDMANLIGQLDQN